ncbi:IS1595-like element ISSsu9 family transposase [Bacteroidales bacterium]
MAKFQLYQQYLYICCMKTKEDIKLEFAKLSAIDQEQLLDELLRDYETRGQILETLTDEIQKRNKKKPCPHCASEIVYKRGKQKGVQMYKCRSCNKWYSETTGTPLWDIKLKNKWQSYLRCMEQGMSIKKTAKEIGISIQTSFDWRHKILSSLAGFTPETLSEVVECDELELALSNKGSRNLKRKPRKRGSDFKRNEASSEPTVVQVVTAVQRNGEKYLKAVESKRLSADEIAKAFNGRLKDKTTLITDKHPSYKLFTKKSPTLKHKLVEAKQYVSKNDKNVHLQHVNNTHSQLRSFLNPFNGVSSKYLQNYLNWFAYGSKLSGTKETIKLWLTTILASPQAYHLFLQFKENAVNIRT